MGPGQVCWQISGTCSIVHEEYVSIMLAQACLSSIFPCHNRQPLVASTQHQFLTPGCCHCSRLLEVYNHVTTRWAYIIRQPHVTGVIINLSVVCRRSGQMCQPQCSLCTTSIGSSTEKTGQSMCMGHQASPHIDDRPDRPITLTRKAQATQHLSACIPSIKQSNVIHLQLGTVQ